MLEAIINRVLITFYCKQYFPMFLMNLVLLLNSVTLVLSPSCSFYITPRKTCTSMLVTIDCLWFECNLLLASCDIELNTRLKQNTEKKNLSALEPQ